jgi:hypothetical protein
MIGCAATLRDAYRAAIARTLAASAILEGLEPGTRLFGQAAADLSGCMRAEMEAGRAFMTALETTRSAGTFRRPGDRD